MRTGFFLLAAIAGLAASLMPQAASAQGNDCFVGATRINTMFATQATTSQTFVDVPGASVNFNSDVPGTCAIVQVTMQLRAADPRIARIRVIVDDGTTTIAPSPASLYTSQHRFDERTVRFVLRNIPAGVHTLKVQFSSINGGAVSLSKVITTVHYNIIM